MPIGVALITLLLFATALINLMTKPLATLAASVLDLPIRRLHGFRENTLKQRGDTHEMHEEFRVTEQPLVDREEMKVRPGNVLVAIRDPRNLYYLDDLLKNTDTSRQDIVVMTARIYHREPTFSGSATMTARNCSKSTSSRCSPRSWSWPRSRASTLR